MQKPLINIINAVPRMPEFHFEEPLNWQMLSKQHWAIIGPNGAGKSIFSNIIIGKIALKIGSVSYPKGYKVSDKIKSIAFRDIYNVADYKNMYYQQRWNFSEDDKIPLVKDILANLSAEVHIDALFKYFQTEDLLEKHIILLSSGELRKLLIIKALLSNPDILILDNPYIGLDAASREKLDKLLVDMSRMIGLQIILVLSSPDDIPDFITHVQPVFNKKLEQSYSRVDFLNELNLINKLFPLRSDITSEDFPKAIFQAPSYQIALKMEHITIKYGQRIILNGLNWEVKKGEKWALLGPNGAGKSTLLSLVCADNPQSYANTFYLFDRKRGSGESIWDIKKNIGYISPEIHLYYLEDVPTLNVVSSGFFDSIGLYRKCTDKQIQIALKWMEIFNINHLKDISFLKLSYGEQRLALLARAFVKNPDLLILDEPLHGLDKSNKFRVLSIIETFCRMENKTLIYVTHYLNEIPKCVSNKLEILHIPS